jgi:hypothetical protein
MERFCKNGIYKVILTSRNSLLNVTTFILVCLSGFLVTKAFTQESIKHYAEFKKSGLNDRGFSSDFSKGNA